VLAVALPLPVIFLLVFVLVSPLTAIFAAVVLGAGFWTPAILSVVVRPIGRVGGGYARLLFQLGLLGYDRPTLEWTSSKYQLREAEDLDMTGETKWYGLAGSLFGFTFEPSPDSWGAEVVDTDSMDSTAEVVADGGSRTPETNVPANYRRVAELKRASVFAGFVPKRFRRNRYYVNTGIGHGAFNDSAVGSKSVSRLLWAKEQYGGEGGLSDRTIIYAMVACGLVSTLLGVFVFYL